MVLNFVKFTMRDHSRALIFSVTVFDCAGFYRRQMLSVNVFTEYINEDTIL